ncbi:FKBP-type peptidyl-prolyl cis-trans isomerase (Rotamase) protein [Imhoffiella purpurea]|uniref:peptidylprolyl isomerase n=2 Tax=Imhoffiella purpurea TaxID=1249627 RepID=W9V3C6_9GAMM|nr:FKBP-type peptidyl-prolyl cis-trans isomerase (Rotamase) protein [Imhoffiella purpurea]
MCDQVVRDGKMVSLTYSILDASGEVLEQNDLPVTYLQGGQVDLVGRMDKAIHGRCAGEEVEILLDPESGFGAYDPDLVFTDDLDNVPYELRHVGAEVQMQNDRGEVRTFFVSHIADGKLTVDGNHPLAGKSLKVLVRIREVRDPTPAERDAELEAATCPTPSIH